MLKGWRACTHWTGSLRRSEGLIPMGSIFTMSPELLRRVNLKHTPTTHSYSPTPNSSSGTSAYYGLQNHGRVRPRAKPLPHFLVQPVGAEAKGWSMVQSGTPLDKSSGVAMQTQPKRLSSSGSTEPWKAWRRIYSPESVYEEQWASPMGLRSQQVRHGDPVIGNAGEIIGHQFCPIRKGSKGLPLGSINQSNSLSIYPLIHPSNDGSIHPSIHLTISKPQPILPSFLDNPGNDKPRVSATWNHGKSSKGHNYKPI